MSKNKRINISRKHGVNPTIPICFWCGKEKNEVALLGRLPGDVEAPMYTCLDYEPCDKCAEFRKQGITIIEVNDSPVAGENQPMYHGCYPTGRNFVIKEEAVKRIFDKENADELIEKRMGFVDKDTMEFFIKMFENGGDDK